MHEYPYQDTAVYRVARYEAQNARTRNYLGTSTELDPYVTQYKNTGRVGFVDIRRLFGDK